MIIAERSDRLGGAARSLFLPHQQSRSMPTAKAEGFAGLRRHSEYVRCRGISVSEAFSLARHFRFRGISVIAAFPLARHFR